MTVNGPVSLDNYLSKERRRYYTINIPWELIGGEARRQVGLIVKRKSGKPSDTEHDWRDIEAIGELKASDNRGVKDTLVQLARYARDVFACQPTRRYLHAFSIEGPQMTAWVFDRSGCYSSGPFNIHKEPERFIRIMAGYTMMNEDELGLDMFIERDGNNRFIRVKQAGDRLLWNVLLSDQGSGLRGLDHVTKFSWTSDRQKPEADLLRLANEKGVEGIARLVAHQPITSIEEMRSDMMFMKPYSFGCKSSAASYFSQSFSQSFQSQPPSAPSRSFSALHGMTIAESRGERLPRKRKSVDAGTNPKKRSKSNSQRSGPPHNEVTYDVDETQGASLVTPSNGPYDNRILCCLVIYPAGRPIHKYRSSLELLQALRDAVKAHKSLYFKGNVLHRDISENNIIITNTEETGFAGMLIDMDLAKELGTGRSGARCRIGTMEFMVIEVLLSADHTYRHDLESFFYVLIWQCARRGWKFSDNAKDRPKASLLTKWYTGTFRDIARIKRSDMGVDGFEDILNEFPQPFGCVKPLCKELRGILFPYGNGLFTGTPKDPEILYRPIIYAFDKAIDGIKAME
ncbi:hypothetical protein ACJ73_08203 [Blastomyces percursus]|uniref:EKC/KEOPS complex subunit BUD32 n=1 Tax=Blastomyces percursus TaxID=1658174 RepID=A0A1J9QYT5_9EURO|nr:hypothetical protein ACJ73_08203 [Blastomyces percursus]